MNVCILGTKKQKINLQNPLLSSTLEKEGRKKWDNKARHTNTSHKGNPDTPWKVSMKGNSEEENYPSNDDGYHKVNICSRSKKKPST